MQTRQTRTIGRRGHRNQVLVALAAASAMILTACGDSGSETPTTAASAPAAASSEPMASNSAETTDATESAETSESSESAETSEPAETSESAESSEPGETSDGGPTMTIGGVADEATVTWFSTLCSGVGQSMDTTINELGTAMSDADPKAGQATIVELLNQMGEQYSTTSGELSALPPPSIDRGPEIAGEFVAALGKGGAAFKAAAAKVETATVTTTDELSTVVTGAMDEVTSAMQGMGSSLDNVDVTAELQAQLEAIPACQTMFG